MPARRAQATTLQLLSRPNPRPVARDLTSCARRLVRVQGKRRKSSGREEEEENLARAVQLSLGLGSGLSPGSGVDTELAGKLASADQAMDASTPLRSLLTPFAATGSNASDEGLQSVPTQIAAGSAIAAARGSCIGSHSRALEATLAQANAVQEQLEEGAAEMGSGAADALPPGAASSGAATRSHVYVNYSINAIDTQVPESGIMQFPIINTSSYNLS